MAQRILDYRLKASICLHPYSSIVSDYTVIISRQLMPSRSVAIREPHWRYQFIGFCVYRHVPWNMTPSGCFRPFLFSS